MASRHIPRYQKLSKCFQKQYGSKPQLFARAPGRVSLLGSHSDCAGYSCVAAALEQDLLMAFSVVEPGEEGAEEIEVHNVDAKFEGAGEKVSNDPEQKF